MMSTFALLFAACSSDGGNPAPDLASRDLAQAADLAQGADLAQPLDFAAAGDLAQPPDLSQLTCAGLLACIYQCTAQNRDTCVGACMNQASNDAKLYFSPLQSCAQPACFAPDGGAGPCVDPSSMACHDCVTADCATQFGDCQAH